MDGFCQMLKIQFDEQDIKHVLSSLKKIEKEVRRQLIDNGGAFNEILSIDYRQLLLKNILTRKTPIPPYNKDYASWKKKHGKKGYPAPWRLSGQLFNEVESFRCQEGWGAGISEIARSSVYATKEESRRPLFEPTAYEYIDGELIQKRANNMLNRISDLWL